METLPLDPVLYKTLLEFAPCFTAPSFQNFLIVISGWIQCLNRHTITGMMEAAGVVGVVHHERFHRLFSKAVWDLDDVAKVLFLLLVKEFVGMEGVIVLGGDDTLSKKTGRKIFGAGYWRDGVLSTPNHVVTRWGLNFVTLGLVVRCPLWPRRDLCFPFLVRLHRKEKTFAQPQEYQTCPQWLVEMVKLVAGWLPDRMFYLAVDGGYANDVVFKGLPANVIQVSRTRADASLYELKPPPTGKRGRPRTKGDPTPKPRERVTDPKTDWAVLTVVISGREVVVEVVTWVGLWYKVAKDHPLRFVLVRDPKNHQRWACFFTTQANLSTPTILQTVAGRWSLEVAFYEAKQYLGVEHAQSRLPKAVERLFPMGMLLVSLVKFWFITYGAQTALTRVSYGPWNRHKTEPSFSDMLAALRRGGWANRFNLTSASPDELQKIIQLLTDRLVRAA